MGCGSSGLRHRVEDRDKFFLGDNSLHTSPTTGRNDQAENEFFAAKLRDYLSQTYQQDKRCPLNERQLYGITKTWRAIHVNFTETAVNMFVRMFETSHEVQYYFCKFAKLETSADLRSSRALKLHAMKVMHTLDDAISNLDDMDYVISMLTKVARTHVDKFDEDNLQIFWMIREPFLLAIKESLGDRFSMSIENTYRICIAFILDTMVKSLVDYRRTKGLPVPIELKDYSHYLDSNPQLP